MATIQQSIDIKVPVHAAYHRLAQFEDYPRFMEEVEAVQQVDDTHLHWTTIMSNRPVEWDAEITEKEPDRCIAWRNVSGPGNAGRVEVQAIGPDSSRVTLVLQAEPDQVSGSPSGNGEAEMAARLGADLARLKEFMEAGDAGLAWPSGTVEDQAINAYGEAAAQGRGETSDPRHTQQDGAASYAAGSEGLNVDEENYVPPASSRRTATEQRHDAAGSAAQRNRVASVGAASTQATHAGPARHLGEMPQDTSADDQGGVPTSDATGKTTPKDR